VVGSVLHPAFCSTFTVVAAFTKIETHICTLFSHSTLATPVLDNNLLLPGMRNSGSVTIDAKVALFAIARYEFTLPRVVWVLIIHPIHANPVIQ